MRRIALRTRLTIIHTGLFLLASLIVVGLIYWQNRQRILGLRDQVSPRIISAPNAVPRMYTDQVFGDVLAGLLLQSLLTFLALGAVAGVLGWWLSGRVLRRVHAMTAQAQRISTANLHERIALDGPQDELKELADTFNGLLARLDDAFQVQGRFIANASHELRTPLAVTRTVIQVGLSSTEPDRVRRAKEELLRSNDRSIALINGLLQLARGERELERHDRVRLDTVVENAVEETDAPSDVTIDVHTEPCEVLGDELLLSQVFRNLLDNAARYNVPGGSVSIRVTAHGQLTVSNTGPVVPADEVALLFEPFHRATDAKDGVGLGLSIVRAIAAAHGGRVAARPRPDGGLVVTVEIPLSGTATGRRPTASSRPST
ncbi:sensor histidine kinase [Kutzneria kofuensis]|uniref:histidine kinase n=1 Tax=Kutzneria kofuensis TaxID=103725 RepID=A0A7W9NEV2_9PSEU|nr:HAMP domain-containing sensor histidine kinase [Kutzneria kofuensis]MBB5889809.1 signal transduction histidine kinase [Kutzneria kofuensis]